MATDIPFARDDAHRLLPAMIACLSAFAALLLAMALSINTTLSDHSTDAIGMLQVEIPRNKADDRLIENVRDALLRSTGVREVLVLGTAQMEGLLKPWMGSQFTLGDLPVPVILDVKTEVRQGKTVTDVESLRKALTKLDGGIAVNDRGPWVAHVAEATGLLQALVVCVALLLLTCVIGMVVLVSKTNLRLHFKAVSLLHMFGATDAYILRQFQWNSAGLVARGATAGVILAALVFLSAVVLSMRWESALLPRIHFSAVHIVLFVLLPVVTSLIALAATRASVQSMLKHMH